MADTPPHHGERRPLEDAGISGESHAADYPRNRPRPPTVPIRPAAEESLEEVESYLRDLFGRYGLSQSTHANRPAAPQRSTEQKTDPIGVPASPVESPAETVESPPETSPLRSLPDPKRPPERRGDILALRELSTRSARGAIAQFETGRIVAATWARFWLCFAALALTLFFLRAVGPLTVRTLAAAAVALVLAVYWCGQFWLLTRQAIRIGKNRKASDAKPT